MIAQENCQYARNALMPCLTDVNGDQLIQHFEQAWQLEETLFLSLRQEDTFYSKPDPLRNPLIFYLGHSAVFYVNKLIRVGLLPQRINPDYESLFEIGVDPSTVEELESATQAIAWPTVEQVWQYRSEAKEAIATAIRQAPLNLPIHPQHPLWAVLMGIEHSRIHFETSSMLIRQLPLSSLQRPADWTYAPTQRHSRSTVPMVKVPGGQVTLGKAKDASTYGWDSDYGYRQVDVQPYWVSPTLVTNREFLAFVEAEGYENPQYWSEAAWDWKQQAQAKHPKFWRSPQIAPGASHDANQTSYLYRAMFDEIALPLDWPVEVNHYEALAYCRWKGDNVRLLTEAEWNQALAAQCDETQAYNLNVRWGSPCAVGQLKHADTRHPISDLRGNVWEWLGDPFVPLPGFEPHPLYEDYSQPFFDDQHFLMVGGSWASTGSYASAQCRNWFRPYFHQHVGFRVAQDAA